MTELYFVRHGQSEANLKEYFAGHTDAPLTKLGKKQAEKTAEYFDAVNPDMVIASPLIRAYETGLAVAKRFDIPIKKDSRLKEVFSGKWEGVTFSEIRRLYEKDYNVWKTDIGNAVCTDGESVKELQQRVKEAVDEIVSANPDKKIVIALHATPIRAMECIWRNKDITEMRNIPWVTNASVTYVRYEKGRGEIIRRSEDSHLKELATEPSKNI